MKNNNSACGLDLDKLDALANAATPGNWEVRRMRGDNGFIQAPRIDPAHGYDIELLGDDDTQYPTRDADMNYIVGIQPAVLRQLTAELRAARAALALKA